ncbi:hypothetical protein NL108_014496 [Boleophthalmus pectinirostris]|nr:hypothetical protein NL108_014496 [Boleophthalmus pectinirostris]
MPQKTKSCNCSRMFSQVPVSLRWFDSSALHTPQHYRPYRQITSHDAASAIWYKYFTHKKANSDSQEVHDPTLSAVSMTMSTEERINLYYFNIIKKYTSHMYDPTKEINRNHRQYIELLCLSRLHTNIK